MKLELDRMALDDTGGNPERMARAILDQLKDQTGPVPIHNIAYALDIDEIREEPLDTFEGALITPPEKGFGAILVNSKSSGQRRRFTVGHELGHFLSPWHRPTNPAGFECSKTDMVERTEKTWHLKQEAEANRFSIELLAPAQRLKPFLYGVPDLQHALDIAEAFDISKAAAVRRYVELRDETLAVIFSRGGIVQYIDRPRAFPFMTVWAGHKVPELSTPGKAGLSDWVEANPADWLSKPTDCAISLQTFFQTKEYAMTLIEVAEPDDEED